MESVKGGIVQTYPEDKLGDLVDAAAKLKGVKIPTLGELLHTSTVDTIAYCALCAQVNVELINAGYTHFKSQRRIYPIPHAIEKKL